MTIQVGDRIAVRSNTSFLDRTTGVVLQVYQPNAVYPDYGYRALLDQLSVPQMLDENEVSKEAK